jgi:transposase
VKGNKTNCVRLENNSWVYYLEVQVQVHPPTFVLVEKRDRIGHDLLVLLVATLANGWEGEEKWAIG